MFKPFPVRIGTTEMAAPRLTQFTVREFECACMVQCILFQTIGTCLMNSTAGSDRARDLLSLVKNPMRKN